MANGVASPMPKGRLGHRGLCRRLLSPARPTIGSPMTVLGRYAAVAALVGGSGEDCQKISVLVAVAGAGDGLRANKVRIDIRRDFIVVTLVSKDKKTRRLLFHISLIGDWVGVD